MTDEEPATSQVERWVRSGAAVIAPATALSALMFYFGYVSARSQYEYFGVDVDTIGLGTQDYIMRSPQPLLVPLLVLILLGLGAQTLHAATRRRIETAFARVGEVESPAPHAHTRQVGRLQRLSRRSITVGIAVLGTGVVLLFLYALVRHWALYNLVTPLLIALGGALIAYGSRAQELIRRHQPGTTPNGTKASQPAATTPANTPPSTLLRRTSSVLVYVLIAASIFWTTATVAQWSGRGLARDQARNLTRLPSVILDTKERLFLRSPGIEETALQESEGQTFHYRYRRLRLLIHGRDRMFLVPETWSASNSTLIVLLNDSVRVQFQFQNQPP